MLTIECLSIWAGPDRQRLHCCRFTQCKQDTHHRVLTQREKTGAKIVADIGYPRILTRMSISLISTTNV